MDGQTFIIPAGKAAGCLPRTSKPGGVCPLAAEHIPLIPRSEWDSLAKGISLRPYVREILDQDGVGSCATESTTQGVMVARAAAGLPHVSLNPWSIYWYTSGGRDGGSSIDENLAYVPEHGICPTELHPRSKGWRAKPSDAAMDAAMAYRIEEFYDITTVDEMVSALLTGFPVVYGAAGHSVLKVAHLDASKGLDVNSWSTAWGDKGCGVWATYSRINWAYGAFAIRVAGQVK